MLKILWVEDQLGGKQVDFFGDRSVTLITNFDDAEKAINSCIQEFDLVVLDINLEESPISQNIQERAKDYGLEEAEFLKECGMSLFLSLLENGFPKERIIFLTANSDEKFDLIDRLEAAHKENNFDEMDIVIEEIQDYLDDEQSKKCRNLIESGNVAELIVVLREYFDGARSGSKNTYNTFCEAYKRCRIKPPEAINKNLKVKIHLNRWIGSHENNQYLMLRRGIVEGCDYLRNKSSRFSSYSASQDKNNEFDLSNYIDILSGFFMITESYNLSHQYKLFVRTLAHEWDDAVRPKKLRLDSKENSQVSLAFSWIMKMTRNWSAHSNVFEELSAQDVAFLFIVNMRAMFDLGSELAPYEKFLLNLFESPLEVEDFKAIYGSDYKARQIPLTQNYLLLLDKYNTNFQAINFHDLLNEVQKKQSENNRFLIKGLYQVFWFLTSYGYVYIDKNNLRGQRYLNYQFAYFDYGTEVYLTEIGRHIYHCSFPEV